MAPPGHPLGGRGFVSPGQASDLRGSDWESITEVGWEHEAGELDRSMRGSRPVGALMHGPTAHTHTPLTPAELHHLLPSLLSPRAVVFTMAWLRHMNTM